MPRDGTGQYSQPFPDVFPGTEIESAVYNGFVNDVELDLNTPRPIVAGGTGASTAAGALTNLGGEIATQVITNYNSDVFKPGSFNSLDTATGGPVDDHAFAGICYAVDANNMFIEARDQSEATQPGHVYVRQKKAGVWSAWSLRDYDTTSFSKLYVSDTVPVGAVAGSMWWETDSGLLFVLYNDGDTTQWVLAMPLPDVSTFVGKAGDTMTGALVQSYDNPRHTLNDTVGAIPDASWAIQSAGAPKWSFGTQVGDATLNFSLYSTPAAKQAYSFDAATALGTIAGDPTAALGIATKQYVDRNASPRNYIVNGAMQISQEYGSASVGLNGNYPVDQFLGTNTTTANITCSQALQATPSGSPNRLRVVVGTAGAATGSQIASIKQRLEGVRTADFMWGSAVAGVSKAFTLQFGFKGPAGTYGLSFYNGASNRIFASAFTIAAGEANTDVVRSVTVPGDLAGTWPIDNSNSLQIEWVFAAGSTIQMAPTVPAGPWSTLGAAYVANTITNNVGATGTFEIFDVGLYKGSSAPPFVVPNYTDALRECERYFYSISAVSGSAVGFGSVWTSALAMIGIWVPRFRATPTLALSTSPSAWSIYTNAASFPATGMSLVMNYVQGGLARVDVSGSGLPQGCAAALLIPAAGGAQMTFNARM